MINGVTLKIKRLQKVVGTLLAAVVLGACGGGGHGGPGVARHVFLIVLENHSAQEALTGDFTASLAAKYGVANNYHAITHPSVPNYLALTSGGVTWRAYMEGLGEGGCLNSPVPYDPGHNPFAFYGGSCPSNVVPFTSFAGDLAGNTPRFSWITPDRCHDTHDCSVATGDEWLKQTVGQITQSRAWKSGGVLFVTWDEDDGSASNQVLTLVLAPGRGHRQSSAPYDHYSLLATIEDILGVGRLGHAAQAQPMNDLVG